MSAAGSDPAFDGRAHARTLPLAPGVYRMLAADSSVLYVGKAKQLRKRVESYFTRALDARLASMVEQIRHIEVILTRTEAEALLLEAQLIKNLKPRYNIDLRDDKSYPYVHLSSDDAWPRLGFHRGARGKTGRYFGPFPSAAAVRDTLDSLFRTFRIRSCEDSVFRNRTRPCLQHQIKRCSAPCVGLVSDDEYAGAVRHATLFLTGESPRVVEELAARMEQAAAELEFEQAADLRDRIAQLRRVQARHYVAGEQGDLDVLGLALEGGLANVQVLRFRKGLNLGNRSYFVQLPLDQDPAELVESFLLPYYAEHDAPAELLLGVAPPDVAVVEDALHAQLGRRLKLVPKPRGERARWVDLAQRTAASALQSQLAARSTLQTRFQALAELLGLSQVPQRIECFDISHTQGEATVASCVVFEAEGPAKGEYRRFNIEGITGGDDFAAMQQALTRRYQRLVAGEGRLPDLLLIDGGKGQLQQALDVLASLKVSGVLAVGIAKGPERRAGFERLFVGAAMREVFPGPEALGGHLIQQIRDEAHRFAIAGHRARRGKARVVSTLEEIAGIGAKRRSALLKHFGGLQGLKRASIEDIARVPGINTELAQRILDALEGR